MIKFLLKFFDSNQPQRTAEQDELFVKSLKLSLNIKPKSTETAHLLINENNNTAPQEPEQDEIFRASLIKSGI